MHTHPALSRRSFVRLAIAVTGATTLASCGGGGDGRSETERQREALARGRAQWERSGLRSYRLVGILSTPPAPSYRRESEVRDGVVVRSEITFLDSAGGGQGSPFFEQYRESLAAQRADVGALFAAVEERLGFPAAKVEVTYDPVFGYPRSLSSAPRDPNIADGASSYVVQLEAL